MKQHDQMQEMLARRSELAAADQARLQEHLEDCPECRDRAQDYARQTALLRSLPVVEPPHGLRAGVLAGIAAPRSSAWQRLRLPALVLASTALIAVVAALALLHYQPSSPRNAAIRTSVPASTRQTVPTAAPTAISGGKPVHHDGGRRRPGGSRPGAPVTPTPRSAPAYLPGGTVIAQRPLPTPLPAPTARRASPPVHGAPHPPHGRSGPGRTPRPTASPRAASTILAPSPPSPATPTSTAVRTRPTVVQAKPTPATVVSTPQTPSTRHVTPTAFPVARINVPPTPTPGPAAPTASSPTPTPMATATP